MNARDQMRRSPTWSQYLTDPAGRLIPERWHGGTLIGIKAIHTILFASIGAAIALFVWDGIRGRPRRRTAYALGIALGETAVYASNNQVCPLTPLAEQFGAESGSVVDIFLPDAVARRIPVVSGTVLVLGIALNTRAVITRRHRLARNGGGDG
ncbi:MAG TPA: hypothetical protein VJY85_08315 [Candidatus Limnocylindria bacterium]|nr:hypothetical protein [Candidatus Limnocylindria bacterium]